jgi:thiamine pyrophosphate-dependent acetolactate synthase large subunit-like protein
MASQFATRDVRYGSDLIVDLLRIFGIEYVAGNPGATWRGLHESLENYRPGDAPRLIEVCHEEIGVAIAHGYAKAAGRPMAVALHNVVGLAHAAMAVFNAWCDRAPIVMLGGTGPIDASRRRPWIDWIHTANLQAELVRPFIKWDDQPISHRAAVDSFAHAYRVATADPPGPVYLCYDVLLQEDVVAADVALPDAARFGTPSPPGPDAETLSRVAGWLVEARHPVILAEGLGIVPGASQALEALSWLLAAPVLEVGRAGGSIRNTYDLDLTGCDPDVLTDADLVLALGVRDLEDALHTTDAGARTTAPLWGGRGRLIDVGLRALSTTGWITDGGRAQPVDAAVTARPDVAVRALLDACRADLVGRDDTDREERRRRMATVHAAARRRWHDEARRSESESPIALAALARVLHDALRGRPWVLGNGNLRGWPRRLWPWEDANAYLGESGGAGLGYGMGAALGVALAPSMSGKVVINLEGDGSLLFTPSALWTAAHHRIPVLTVVVNNRSYYQDEAHQRWVAKSRGRSIERALHGVRLRDPDVDFGALARSMGVHGVGPIERLDDLPGALAQAVEIVANERRPALVDVLTQPR